MCYVRLWYVYNTIRTWRVNQMVKHVSFSISVGSGGNRNSDNDRGAATGDDNGESSSSSSSIFILYFFFRFIILSVHLYEVLMRRSNDDNDDTNINKRDDYLMVRMMGTYYGIICIVLWIWNRK